MAAYYNEFDPFAAGWLRELIAAGLIAPGEVDERSIEDVTSNDLRGFQQCHFFAGIGVWSHALRLAGWPDDRVVWTGSCPCQPFSAAGKRGGAADERHLWPAFFHLIDECRPPVVLGEQVASKDGLAWLDLVSSDMEGAGYAFGAVDTCAAGFGAPHIRQRLWFVGLADASSESESRRGVFRPGQSNEQSIGAACERPSGLCTVGRLEHQQGNGRIEGRAEPSGWGAASGCGVERVADGDGRDTGTEGLQRSGEQRQQPQDGGAMRMAQPSDARSSRTGSQSQSEGTVVEPGDNHREESPSGPGPLNGFWRDADWLLCRDGRWRPVKPGTFPLVNGASNRVGLLRGAGNAIVSEAAAGFVEAVMDALSDHRL